MINKHQLTYPDVYYKQKYPQKTLEGNISMISEGAHLHETMGVMNKEHAKTFLRTIAWVMNLTCNPFATAFAEQGYYQKRPSQACRHPYWGWVIEMVDQPTTEQRSHLSVNSFLDGNSGELKYYYVRRSEYVD